MNGALYTKKKVTKCDICTYWNGTGVSTMRSHGERGEHAFALAVKVERAASHVSPRRRSLSTATCILVAATFGRFETESNRTREVRPCPSTASRAWANPVRRPSEPPSPRGSRSGGTRACARGAVPEEAEQSTGEPEQLGAFAEQRRRGGLDEGRRVCLGSASLVACLVETRVLLLPEEHPAASRRAVSPVRLASAGAEFAGACPAAGTRTRRC